MQFMYNKLKGKIVEVYGTLGNFSKTMGWSEHTNSLKINGKIEWKQREILKACSLLDIPIDEISDYFFKVKVQ